MFGRHFLLWCCPTDSESGIVSTILSTFKRKRTKTKVKSSWKAITFNKAGIYENAFLSFKCGENAKELSPMFWLSTSGPLDDAVSLSERKFYQEK